MKQPVRAPVTDDAVAELHALFGGNVRGLLLALEEAAHALIEFGGAAAESMTRDQIRYILQGRMMEGIEANLDANDVRHLARLAESGVFDGFTQSDIARVCGVNQSAASKISHRLEATGYLTATTAPVPGKPGRPTTRYDATALVRLAFNAPAPPLLLP